MVGVVAVILRKIDLIQAPKNRGLGELEYWFLVEC